jgi:hypothetical protein
MEVTNMTKIETEMEMIKRLNYKWDNGEKVPLVDWFWKRVDVKGINDCWPWLQGTNGCGYGAVFLTSVPHERIHMVGAHRLSWILTHGEIPKGMLICHHCDNPICVNPAHLFMGTYHDNAIDCHDKGRHDATLNHPKVGKRAKEDIIFLIKELYGTEIGA